MARKVKVIEKGGSLIIPGSRSLIRSILSLGMLPFTILGGVTSGFLSLLLPRRILAPRSGIFSLMFSLCKLSALAFLLVLILEPSMLSQMNPSTRNIIGIIAVVGGVVGFLSAVSGVISVGLLCCFWFIATIYLSQQVFSYYSGGKSFISKEIPTELPGGLKYHKIPKTTSRFGERFAQKQELSELGAEEGSSLASYSPLPAISDYFGGVSKTVNDKATFISNSVTATVADSVNDFARATGISTSGAYINRSYINGAHSGTLPDSAFFPPRNKTSGFYSMRGARKKGVLESLTDYFR
jgi:hypothetical protein